MQSVVSVRCQMLSGFGCMESLMDGDVLSFLILMKLSTPIPECDALLADKISLV